MPKIYRSIPVLTPQELARFTQYINATSGQGPHGDCWTWSGGLNSAGYGQFWLHGTTVEATRVMYALVFGDPGQLNVCHSCDFPECVNWHHFFSDTQKGNIADCIRKNRFTSGDRNGIHLHPEKASRGDAHYSRVHPEKLARGERNANAVATTPLVLSMRARYDAKLVGPAQLVRETGLSRSAVKGIIYRKTWKHLP